MKHRLYGVSLAEVIIASGISAVIILFVVSASIGISKFSHEAIVARSVDTQMTQGADAITKELRDGVAILPTSIINGTTYTTSSNCVVLSAIGYDFSKANPILPSTDVVVFRFVPSISQLSRTCLSGTGSKRPKSSDAKILGCTDAKFSFRVSEVIDWLSTSTATVTETFKLVTVPVGQPVCTRNGISVPCAWQSGSQTVSIQTPPGASMFGVQYNVSPTPANCQHITSVELQLKRTIPMLNASPVISTHITEARLRNKR